MFVRSAQQSYSALIVWLWIVIFVSKTVAILDDFCVLNFIENSTVATVWTVGSYPNPNSCHKRISRSLKMFENQFIGVYSISLLVRIKIYYNLLDRKLLQTQLFMNYKRNELIGFFNVLTVLSRYSSFE